MFSFFGQYPKLKAQPNQHRLTPPAVVEGRRQRPLGRLTGIFGAFLLGALAFSPALSLTAQPTNDNFTNRIVLGSLGGTVTGSNVGATREAGEPFHAGYGGFKSVWWSWSPSVSGRAVIDTLGSSFDTVLAVYTGNSVSHLNLVPYGSDDDTGSTKQSRVAIDVTAGRRYQIAVDGYQGASGRIRLTVQAPTGPRPPNDNFTNRIPISSAGGAVSGNNIDATRQSGEPLHAGSGGGKSVWWTWTPTNSGNAIVNTFGSSFDTVLAVYTGNTVASLNPVPYGSNDDASGTKQSQVTISVTAGRRYQIAVDGFQGASGNIQLRVIPPVVARPTNDNFANRITIGTLGGTVTGNNVGATRQAREPVHAGYAGGKSVWWTWTPSTNGSAVINTFGSSFDTVLAVYTGSSIAGLSLVPYGSNDDFGSSRQSQVTINVRAGTPYQIAVDGYQGASGSIRLRVIPPVGSGATPALSAAPALFANAQTPRATSVAPANTSARSSGPVASASSTPNPAPVPLMSGQTLSGLAGAQGSAQYYQLSVPASQAALSARITGGTGDCDLYLRYAALPTLTDYNVRPYLGGNSELATAPAPAAGVWFILLYGSSAYSDVTLQVEFGQEPVPAGLPATLPHSSRGEPTDLTGTSR